jgi:O-antigen/teichoic acid export membrane protein
MAKAISKIPSVSASSILSRFAKVFSAQSAEGLLQTAFFLYLAWLDQFVFGEVQYAFAASALVVKIAQFGLYFPLVTQLGEAEDETVPTLMDRANLIKFGLTILTMLFLIGMALMQGFSLRMSLMIFFICLGYALEQVAESYFAYLRVQGRQGVEAKIKATASVVSYGYGAGVMAMGMNPLIMSLYRLLSTGIRLGWVLVIFLRSHPGRFFTMPELKPVLELFKYASIFAFIQILGVFLNKTNVFFLERYSGVQGVAYYSAGFLTVDGVSVLASEQLLSWVIFPLLSALWWKNREEVGPLVRNASVWLLAISLPIIFFLYNESHMIIGLMYPPEYKDAIWIQQVLAPSILFSFENNLFCFVMMVAGSAKLLLVFSIIGAIVNIILNITLTPAYGLLGACLVIVLSKFTMMVQTSVYCQWRLRLFNLKDFAFPVFLAAVGFLLFLLLKPLTSIHIATIVPLIVYFLALWRIGPKVMGQFQRKQELENL